MTKLLSLCGCLGWLPSNPLPPSRRIWPARACAWCVAELASFGLCGSAVRLPSSYQSCLQLPKLPPATKVTSSYQSYLQLPKLPSSYQSCLQAEITIEIICPWTRPVKMTHRRQSNSLDGKIYNPFRPDLEKKFPDFFLQFSSFFFNFWA